MRTARCDASPGAGCTSIRATPFRGVMKPTTSPLMPLPKCSTAGDRGTGTSIRRLRRRYGATIDSDINHLADSADNARGRRLAVESSKDEAAQAYTVPGTEPNPVTTVIDCDWQNRFHKAAMKELKDDPFLIKIFECLEAEITKPEEIAVVLDTTPEEVNNAKKRLRRKLEKLDGKCPPPNRRAKV